VAASTGKNPIVAPYSGAILATVALSAKVRLWTPGPKYSTNFPTTFFYRNIYVQVNTRSVAVAVLDNSPINLNPITSGNTIEVHSPSITASASIPPTPHPKTPRPFIIVVWESVPTTESGYTTLSFINTDLAKYSKLTWWTIPDPGGTILRF